MLDAPLCRTKVVFSTIEISLRFGFPRFFPLLGYILFWQKGYLVIIFELQHLFLPSCDHLVTFNKQRLCEGKKVMLKERTLKSKSNAVEVKEKQKPYREKLGRAYDNT